MKRTIACTHQPNCNCTHHVSLRMSGFDITEEPKPKPSKPRKLPLPEAKEKGGQTTL